MEHYVTLFDSLFLPQGMALHQSMERHAGVYTLWVLCMDAQCFQTLRQLDLPNVRALASEALETPELLAVKPTRTRGEYCWTMTPFAPRFVFEQDKTVQRVTYVDADLWLLKNPAPIFRELDESGKQVLITEHAYAPEYDQSAICGRFCVQFMTFVREESEPVRQWWEDRCIEWCYARAENGKYGDQKYLDDWPERFGNLTHILHDKELALAPWNAMRFPYGNAVFYHFHNLRILSERKINLGFYSLLPALLCNVYAPYLKDLKEAISCLKKSNFKVLPQGKPVNLIRRVYHNLQRARSVGNILFPSGTLKW